MLSGTFFRVLQVRSGSMLKLMNWRTGGNSEVVLYNIIKCRSMAGHSKWQNIKHVKAAKDKEKASVHNKYCRLVRYAVRDKGPDPKLNTKLADILEEARNHNVPYSTLENSMKRASSGKLKSGFIEILGPGGCYVVLDYETDNISIMRHSIKTICKKYNGNIAPGEGGRWRAFYEQKGILKVTRSNDGQNLDAEKALDVAIEAGAEDVQLKTTEEEAPYLEFYCEPANLFSVKKGVELSFTVEEAYVGFIANVTVELSDEVMETASNFFAELGELSEIVRIYENVQ